MNIRRRIDRLKAMWRTKWGKYLSLLLLFSLVVMVLFVLASYQPILKSNKPNTGNLLQVASNPLDDVKIKTETIVGREGFFRVGKSTKGRWWLINPENQPFFYKGVTSVGDGRGISPTTSPTSEYTKIVTQKYGGDSTKLRTVIFKQLRSWNFNAIGAWSASDLWDQGMPYTIVLDFAKVGPRLPNKLPDVFSPEWLKGIDVQAKKLVAPRRDSKDLVGYFTDNELGWADGIDNAKNQAQFLPKYQFDPVLTDKVNPTFLQICLSLKENQPVYQAAWQFVLQKHGGNLAQLAKDWQIEITSQNSLKQLTDSKQTLVSLAFLKDNYLFWQEFARRYFEQSAEAIRRYDQNHLLLGCRFGSPPNKAVFSVVKHPWIDVVSFNNYRYKLYEKVDIYYQNTKLPVLLTEFSWGHNQFSMRRLPEDPKRKLSQPETMIRNGEKSLALALTHPGLVGYTWYRWIDRPSYPPSSPTNMGLITVKDEPNRWHTDLLTQLNAKAENIVTTDFGYQ